MAKTAGSVTGLDQYSPDKSGKPNVEYRKWNIEAEPVPVDVSDYDQVFMLDIHRAPEGPGGLHGMLRTRAVHNVRRSSSPRRTSASWSRASCALRPVQLRPQRHSRPHTHAALHLRSLRELFEQTGYNVLEIRGIPRRFRKSSATACSEKSSWR